MSSRLPDLFGRATAVLGEHATLRTTVIRLRTLCPVLQDGGLPSDTDIHAEMNELAVELHAHFAAEESDAYFGTLVVDCPRLAARVARLVEEHRQMRAAARLLEPLARGAEGRPQLASRLDKLLDSLERHERAENLLLQEFFGRDEGSG